MFVVFPIFCEQTHRQTHTIPFRLRFAARVIIVNNEEFASFATRRISTLTNISGHLKGIVSYRNTQYYKLYVFFNLSVYIS